MHPQYLSNAYVVAEEAGGTAVFVDSGAPLEPLLEVVEEQALTPTHLLITHGHADHVAGNDELVDRFGLEVTTGAVETGALRIEVLATPGHSPDSVCLLMGRMCFTGDTVLGEGSVFIAPGEGSLSAYLGSLRRLRSLDLDVLCPGHGPYVDDPAAKLDEYIAHRLDRERRLLEALRSGLRTEDELLDAAWPEVPAELRPAAALTLAAHLEKLREEGRLPPGMPGE